MSKIQVFTVSQLDDIKVEKYLKPVTYHVVIGMNFFADFMQSFTDFFGGSSLSYQKRLKEINESVIEGIKNEVRKVGGNCAIDLRIDNDEISAKGKSMIMVTGIATAVVIKQEKNNISEDLDVTRIDSDKYKLTKELNRIKENVRLNISYLANKEVWDFFINNKLTSQFDYLAKALLFFSKGNNYIVSSLEDYYVEYLSIFDEDDIKEKFYSFIEPEGEIFENKGLLKSYLNLLEHENLYYINSTEKNLELMKSDSKLLIECGFWLSLKNLQSYSKIDLENYNKIIEVFKIKFPVISEYTDKELKCSKCDEKVSRRKRCKKCDSDLRGIGRESILFNAEDDSNDHINEIEERIKIINQAYNI
jgi:uncharacterized protein YbjQ (UPF0145 family)